MIYLVTPPTGNPIAFIKDIDAWNHIRNLGFEWNPDDNLTWDGTNVAENPAHTIWRDQNDDVLHMIHIKLIGDYL